MLFAAWVGRLGVKGTPLLQCRFAYVETNRLRNATLCRPIFLDIDPEFRTRWLQMQASDIYRSAQRVKDAAAGILDHGRQVYELDATRVSKLMRFFCAPPQLRALDRPAIESCRR